MQEVHPLFLRLDVSVTNQAQVIKSLLQRNAWFNFSIVSSEGEGSNAFVQSLRDQIQTPGWNIRHDVRFPADAGTRFLRNIANDDSYVVMVLHCSPRQAQAVFRAARELKLLGKGHALIGTESLLTYDKSILKDYPTGLLIVKHMDAAPLKDHLHDAFTLVARSAGKLKWEGGVRNISCWLGPGSSQLEYANNFYSTMTNTSFKGNTGNIKFDQNGDLVDSSYHIMNLIEESPTGHDWKEVGSWRRGSLKLETVVWPGNTMVMPVGVDTHKLIIATNTEKPFIFFSNTTGMEGECTTGVQCLKVRGSNSTRRDMEKAFEEFRRRPDGGNYSHDLKCCTGLCVDLIERMSQDLNFKYDLYLVADTNHGAIENGTWNGMVGDLITGKADAAISSFSITRERSAVIDFTAPFFHSGFSTLVAKKQREQTLGAFLAPLHPNVWTLIFASALVMAVCLTISEWSSPYGLHPGGRNRNSTFSFPSALTITFAILFSNTIKTKPPKCMTSRMLLNVWGGFSLIFFSSYTANLAAFLAGQMSYLSIEDLNDPKLKNPTEETTVGTVTGSSIQNYLMSLNPGLHRFMENYVQLTTEEAITSLKQGELDVFIYDSPVIEYRMANDPECSLVSVGKPFGEEGYGIGVSKDSPLRDTVSGKILEYELDGILEELQRKWFETLGCMKEDILDPTSGGEDNTVTIAHVGGLLLLLVSGVIISCLILLVEFAVHKYMVPNLRKVPKHRRDCLVLSQRLHHEINSDYKVRSSANMRELLTLVKQGEFAKMLQKEQRPAAPEEIEARRDIRNAVQAGMAGRSLDSNRSNSGIPHLRASEQQEYLQTMDDCNEDHSRRQSRNSDAKPKYSWRYFTPEDFLDHNDETEMDRLLSRGIVVPIRHVGETSAAAPPTSDHYEHSGNSPAWESHVNMVPIEMSNLHSADIDAGLYANGLGGSSPYTDGVDSNPYANRVDSNLNTVGVDSNSYANGVGPNPYSDGVNSNPYANGVGSNPAYLDVDIVPYADEGEMSDCRRDSFASGSYEMDDLLSFMSDELAQGHLGRACLASPETDDGTASQGHSSLSSGGAEHLPCEGATLPRTSSLPSYDSAMYYPPLVCPTPSENTPEKVMNCKTSSERNSSFS
ncbi:glutamate receptor ionotropic, NMDA 3B-like isoform X2 [Asterias rubens]|uniref:glutamate receptor ionotropic, NMDA 3B-like isoform X2 n=1 Tax=Asterias rubens TaxID=7604 RepID=UPI0014554570|nr:glutamate receptor ionotropic, NMDA 3B-like isoform X2 [Asterias rubens]